MKNTQNIIHQINVNNKNSNKIKDPLGKKLSAFLLKKLLSDIGTLIS
jgi:hypothetical protein